MNKGDVSKQIQKINALLDVLSFAYRVHNIMGVNGCRMLFGPPLEIEGGSMALPGRDLSDAHAEEILHNQIMSGVCSLVLTLDEVLCDLYPTRDAAGDNYADNLRTVIYMLRCTFAHGPCNPKWDVKSKYRRYVELEIPDEVLKKEEDNFSKFYGFSLPAQIRKISFDFPKLNERVLEFKHFQGLPGLIILSKMVQHFLISHKTVYLEI